MSGEQSQLEADLTGLHALDPQVVSSVHSRYFPELFRYARYRLGDEALAEDIAGETLARLLEAIHAGQGPRTSLRGWLIGTASNLVNDHLRSAYVHPVESLRDDLDLHSNGPLPHLRAELSERQRAVQEALAKLTPEQQQVISLRFGGGYSLEETAILMKRKINAIKALQFRALSALQRVMTQEIL